MEPLPEHIADLIRKGRKIEAIKLIREETGVGLQEAKDAVERLAAGMDPLPASEPVVVDDVLPAEVEMLARAGRKIEAIQVLRARTGLGLKEAKERVDAIPGAPAAQRGVVGALAIAILLVAIGIAAALFFAAA